MGSEAACRVRYGGQASTGKALLETSELLFRGDFRLKIAFRDITRAEAVDGELRVAFGDQTAVFELGRVAAAWAEKIRNPRGLLDKLGVRPGLTVAAIDIEDRDFLADLHARLGDACLRPPVPDLDLLFAGIDDQAGLSRIEAWKSLLGPKGALWLVFPKGKATPLREVAVIQAGRAAGLVDNKVASFSGTHSALRFVVRQEPRQT